MAISDLTKMVESYPNGWKTLWEKEKLLVTSNFSFSHSVFKRLVSQGRQKVSLCGNGLSGICENIYWWCSQNENFDFSPKETYKKIFCLFHAFNPFPNKHWFLHVCSTNLLKTQWEKEKLLVTSNFFFFHSVFDPSEELSSIFINFKIVVCKLIQFGRV